MFLYSCQSSDEKKRTLFCMYTCELKDIIYIYIYNLDMLARQVGVCERDLKNR